MRRRYEVELDNEATAGVETTVTLTVNDLADANAVEGLVAEAVRRTLAAYRADNPLIPSDAER